MTIIVKDFLDDKGDIRPELLDGEAMEIAEELSKSKLSTHQVRKFFDEVKNYKARIDKGEDFRKIMPLIVMLKSKAKYASRKKEMNVFRDFLYKSIEKIKEDDGKDKKEKFNAFCLFFEAVYGFANLKK